MAEEDASCRWLNEEEAEAEEEALAEVLALLRDWHFCGVEVENEDEDNFEDEEEVCDENEGRTCEEVEVEVEVAWCLSVSSTACRRRSLPTFSLISWALVPAVSSNCEATP